MARNFDSGNPDYIDHGNPSALDLTGTEVTLSLWVRASSNGVEKKILAKWADAGGQFSYLLSILGSDLPLGAINTGVNSVVTGTTDVVDGQWHHLALTYDGSDVRLYVDGVEEDSDPETGSLNSGTAPVRLGAGSGGAGTENPYTGDLGHAAIWDVGLSASEVASLAAGISPRRIRPGALLFYNPLNGQSPEADVIGGNTGTLTGTTVVEEPPIPYSIVAPG